MTRRRVGRAPVTSSGVPVSTGPVRPELSLLGVIAPVTRADIASYEDNVAVTAVPEFVR